jgi:hypothetical protein
MANRLAQQTARAKDIAAVGCFLACAFLLAVPANAGTAYSENFDAGASLNSDSLGELCRDQYFLEGKPERERSQKHQ